MKLFLTFLATLALAGCGGRDENQASESHEHADDAAHGRQDAEPEDHTTIARDIAEAAGVKTEIAGPATMATTITLYGRIAPDPAKQRDVSARFPGVIQSVHKKLGDVVRSGETLAVVESNESLRTYNVVAPIGGVITARNANPGEQSGERALFTIIDPTSVTAELSLFPADHARVRQGARVTVRSAQSEHATAGSIERIELHAAANQSVTARVGIDNSEGRFLPGAFVTAEVEVSRRPVGLAVKTTALQPIRDAMVVFEQVGETYEARVLELGETQGEWAEVLDGIEPGARYVTENSYLIKADIEKAGVSHDH